MLDPKKAGSSDPASYFLYKLVQDILIQFLLAAGLLGFTRGNGMAPKIFQGQFACLKLFSFAAVKGGIPLLPQGLVIGFLQDIVSDNQASCKSVHAAHMRMKEVVQIGGVSSDFRVKIDPAGT